MKRFLSVDYGYCAVPEGENFNFQELSEEEVLETGWGGDLSLSELDDLEIGDSIKSVDYGMYAILFRLGDIDD
jgi:hypothetical protein